MGLFAQLLHKGEWFAHFQYPTLMFHIKQEMKTNGTTNQHVPIREILSMGNQYYHDFYKVVVDDETLGD